MVLFRKALEADIDLLLQFINAIAVYEKLENEVVANRDNLHEWLFDKQIAEALILTEEVGGEPIGFALYFFNFSTFVGRAGLYLEDLFIYPEYRGRGYGKKTLIKLAQIAKERGCGRMEWVCLDWNKSSIDFYLSLGAEPMSDWTTYRLNSAQVAQLADSNS
ncbi:MAG: GNAT family N-acetyltransferase [bacterium]